VQDQVEALDAAALASYNSLHNKVDRVDSRPGRIEITVTSLLVQKIVPPDSKEPATTSNAGPQQQLLLQQPQYGGMVAPALGEQGKHVVVFVVLAENSLTLYISPQVPTTTTKMPTTATKMPPTTATKTITSSLLQNTASLQGKMMITTTMRWSASMICLGRPVAYPPSPPSFPRRLLHWYNSG
jgi:hypothetical protein